MKEAIEKLQQIKTLCQGIREHTHDTNDYPTLEILTDTADKLEGICKEAIRDIANREDELTQKRVQPHTNL